MGNKQFFSPWKGGKVESGEIMLTTTLVGRF